MLHLWGRSILPSPSLGSQWSESGVCTSFLWLRFWVSMPSLGREGVGFHRGSQTKGRKAASIVWNDFFLGREWGSSVWELNTGIERGPEFMGPLTFYPMCRLECWTEANRPAGLRGRVVNWLPALRQKLGGGKCSGLCQQISWAWKSCCI